MCVHVHMEAIGQPSVLFLSHLPPWIFEAGLSLGPRASWFSQAAWPGSLRNPTSASPVPANTPDYFMWVLGVKLTHSCWHDMYFTKWATSQDPHMLDLHFSQEATNAFCFVVLFCFNFRQFCSAVQAGDMELTVYYVA